MYLSNLGKLLLETQKLVQIFDNFDSNHGTKFALEDRHMMKTFLVKLRLLPPVQALGFCVLFCPAFSFAAKSPYFDQVKSFLPNDVRLENLQEVLPGSEISEQIDSLLLKVLSSKTGKIFCNAFGENYSQFQNTLFINAKNDRIGYDLCKGNFSKEFTHRVWKKTYYIGYTKLADFAATGWTNSRNETFVFLNRDIDPADRLSFSILHETAISLDRKEGIGFGGLINFTRTDLVENKNSCLISAINRKTKMKHLFAALRAFEMERLLAEEIGLKLPAYLKMLATMNCKDRINFLNPYMTAFHSALEAESFFNLMFDSPACFNPTPISAKVDEIAELLTNTEIQFKNKSERNACDYLTEGLPFLPGPSFRGGPGPRIGGGW